MRKHRHEREKTAGRRKGLRYMNPASRTVLREKWKEAFTSVLPISAIVLLLCFLLVPLPSDALTGFLFGAVLLFQLVTLPVELDASRRGLLYLEQGSYIDGEQKDQAREVLKAAAMTYVWATVASLISFLRLLSIGGSSRRSN